ncbi:Carnitine O-palmitoyltransferase 2, mitochondrial [Cichlidogyrus casuarinus]|uniref:Carnitine O-palmitoyltransferase 2, mitochondrial n=1 Tax=Cichlidogyrus casuarinus TaxID=1844966 RepID=A0ABD2Q6U1_9PLAT
MKIFAGEKIRFSARKQSLLYRSITTLKDSDFLHKSVLHTDKFQASLPRLKIPPLDKTIARYLDSQAAVLCNDELEKTKKIANSFLVTEAPALQYMLLEYDKANTHTSYITKFWSDMYLADRRPVVLTHQAMLVFKDSERGPLYQNPIARTTNMIISCCRFKNSFKNNLLFPEVYHLNPKKSDTDRFRNVIRRMPNSIATYCAYMFKAFPLDMSQYKNLFNSTRIPKSSVDELQIDSEAKHVAIIKNNQIYTFDVMDDQGCIIAAEQILSNVAHIYNLPKTKGPGIGVITAMPRDQAATARHRLELLGNAESFKAIDGALCVFCLDDTAINDPHHYLKEVLSGPCENRWFDKSFSIITDQTGQTALTFEHSWGDGVAVLRLFNEVFKDTEASPRISYDMLNADKANLPTANVRTLHWKLDEQLEKEILPEAVRKYDQWRGKLDLRSAQVKDKLTKETCKHNGLSPDAVMQLLMQLANDKVHSRPSPTYESCSTAAFKHGRTECLRSATVQTRKFVESMRNADQHSKSDLLAMLKQCSEKHNQLTKEAAMGQGRYSLIDRRCIFGRPAAFHPV